jgi:hypothetical protein
MIYDDVVVGDDDESSIIIQSSSTSFLIILSTYPSCILFAGDIVIPGLFVALLLRLDATKAKIQFKGKLVRAKIQFQLSSKPSTYIMQSQIIHPHTIKTLIDK